MFYVIAPAPSFSPNLFVEQSSQLKQHTQDRIPSPTFRTLLGHPDTHSTKKYYLVFVLIVKLVGALHPPLSRLIAIPPPLISPLPPGNTGQSISRDQPLVTFLRLPFPSHIVSSFHRLLWLLYLSFISLCSTDLEVRIPS